MAADDQGISDDGDAGQEELPEINQCPACEGDIDIAGLGPFTKIVCPHCEKSVRVRTQLGNYHISQMLGEGGMSQVFLAEDLTLDRKVALKILHQELSRDAALMSLFEREAKLTASINHPNVVKVYTVGSDAGYFFIAMELIDNVSLETRIAQDGMLKEREALDLLHDIAAGLRTAFQGGLIHRDIKPGNILLTKSGAGKLVDFGLALQQGGDDEVEDLWATPFYVPPEKLDGKPDDFRGDIYSLGATFFHALAGRPPFNANTASLEELREIKGKPVSLKEASAPVSVPTIKLIDRMMAYKPENRFKNYDELLAAIEEVQSKLPGGAASRARRQSVLEGAQQGLSGVAWFGIIGGAIVIAGIAIAMLGGNGNGGGTLSDTPMGGGGDRVLSAGQRNVSVRYTEGRDLLLAGRAGAAAKVFEELLKSGELKQPTLGWTQLNLDLAGLLEGAKTGKESTVDAGAGDLTDPVAAFVRKVSLVLADPLPVLPETGKQLAPNSLESIGLLAYGLKNWNHGQFGSAIEFFDAFAAATVPADHAWMGAYRTLADPYRKDFALVEKLPKPSVKMSEAELEEARLKLKAAEGALATRGGARVMTQERLGRIDDLLKAKKALATASPELVPTPVPNSGTMTPPGPGGGNSLAWTPEAEAERGRLAEAISAATGTMTAFRFAEAAGVVSGFPAETAPVKQLQADYLEALKQADAFKERLVATLSSNGFEGKLLRKQGLPLDLKIVSVDADKLVVDLMFGPNDLPWAEVSPAWMLTTARETWLSGSPEEANVTDWIQAACFARQTGLSTEATKLSELLASLSSDFAEQWERIKPLP